MIKNLECPKCVSFRWIAGCAAGGRIIRCAHVIGLRGELCPGFWPFTEPPTPKPEAPAIKPLVVDALAIAAKLLLEKLDNIGDGMLFNLDILDARDILRKAVARHQEKMSHAEV